MPELLGRKIREFRHVNGVDRLVGVHPGLRDGTSRKNQNRYKKQSHEW